VGAKNKSRQFRAGFAHTSKLVDYLNAKARPIIGRNLDTKFARLVPVKHKSNSLSAKNHAIKNIFGD